MNEIFISYSRFDRAFTERLAAALEQKGFSVWWDKKIIGGERFDNVITQALQEAKCIIVIWSKKSVGSEWVLGEAEVAKNSGRVIPILIDAVDAPIEFRRIQQINLGNWDGCDDMAEFVYLVESINNMLKKKVATTNVSQSEETHELLSGISKKMLKIKPVYLSVSNRLKRMAREGSTIEDSDILVIIRRFLSEDVTAEEFMEMWDVVVSQKVAVAVEPKYDIIAQRLKHGDIIPFFGPESHHVMGFPIPSSEELVQTLSQDAQYDDFQGSLSMISQYYQMTELGRNTLVRKVKEIVEPLSTVPLANPLYKLIVSLHNPLLVLNASYDTLLEGLFMNAGKKFVTISHLKIDGDIGKVVIDYSDNGKSRIILSSEEVSACNFLENGYTVIYKICGCLNDYGYNDDSLLISEVDYFHFARRIENAIPSYISRHFSRQSLLFLGSNLIDWQLRMIISTLLEKNSNQRERSYVIDESVTKYEKEFWKYHTIDLFNMKLSTFIEELVLHI
ncbi:MAG: TIR domain-containing protein [Chitinispirillaceae bacterium]|nr:TIR domain-containing protein [Chitinispirillaceae bacterium]